MNKIVENASLKTLKYFSKKDKEIEEECKKYPITSLNDIKLLARKFRSEPDNINYLDPRYFIYTIQVPFVMMFMICRECWNHHEKSS